MRTGRLLLILSVLTAIAVGCGGRSTGGVGDTGPAAGDGAPPAADMPTSPTPDGPAGATCGANDDCASTEYCHWPTGACLINTPPVGDCRPLPRGCDKIYSPVCGCDFKTYGNACEAYSVGMSLAHNGACSDDTACGDANCHVINDCCTCAAVKYTGPPPPRPPCTMSCKQPMCDGIGFQQPVTYCLAGQCLLANTLKGCGVDADCVKVDDCCHCGALPKSVSFVPCPADCFVDDCTAKGLGKAQPRCVAGTCRLVLP